MFRVSSESSDGEELKLFKIDEVEYAKNIEKLIEKKQHDYRKEKNPYLLKNKIAKYVMSRGFEGDLVWSQVNEFLKT